jgi:serine phosphatase RsbU (regulator of sigma subunit)
MLNRSARRRWLTARHCSVLVAWLSAAGLAQPPREQAKRVHDDIENLASKEYGARVAALQDLTQIGSGAVDAVPDIIKATSDRYSQVREQAVRALGEVLKGSSDLKTASGAIRSLVRTCADTSPKVPSAARGAVKTIGAVATTTLVEITRSGDDSGAREFAIELLADSNLLTVEGALGIERLIHDPDEAIRRKSAQAISGAIQRCVVQDASCARKLSNIERLTTALVSQGDPVVQQYGTSADIAARYLRQWLASQHTKLEQMLGRVAPYAALFSLASGLVLPLLTVQLLLRGKRIRRLSQEMQSISQEKATQEQNEKARAILKRFVTMPEREERPGFVIAAAFQGSSEVSGDFYNWFSRIDGSVCLYLVDVEGSGIDAAIQATHAYRVLERALTRGEIEKAASLLEKADRVVHEELGQPNIVLTMNLVEIYPRRIELANAGMPPPLLFRYGQAQPQELQAAGVYVGGGYSRFHVEPRSAMAETSDGDLLVLFSDGVLEGTDQEGRIFGRAGIESAVTRERDRAPDVIARSILKAAAESRGNRPPMDDQTVVVVRFGQYKPLAAGAKTLVPLIDTPNKLEFTLINAANIAEVCHSELRPKLKEWLQSQGPQEAKEIWCVIWEALSNAVVYGSYSGDIFSLRIRRVDAGIAVEIEQPRDWRDWDRWLGTRRKDLLPDGAPQADADLGGTAVLLKLGNRVFASMQGRLLTLLFQPKGALTHEDHGRTT